MPEKKVTGKRSYKAITKKTKLESTKYAIKNEKFTDIYENKKTQKLKKGANVSRNY